jgi:protein-L-isoaspartate(D-aspartate) O-methyltransferase
METVPRHRFVPPEYPIAAYANRLQRIGYGQTISHPFFVVLIADLLYPGGDESVP